MVETELRFWSWCIDLEIYESLAAKYPAFLLFFVMFIIIVQHRIILRIDQPSY